MSSQPPKPATRGELRELYGVSKKVFRRWLKVAGITHRRRTLTPKEVADVYGKLASNEA